MPRPLVALDLDGTLLPRADCLPEAHIQAVARLLDMGVAVALVTGRPLLTTAWVWRRLGLASALVCFNGGWVGMPSGATIATAPLSEAQTRRAIASLDGLGGAISAYPDASTWVMDRAIAHTARWRELYGADIQIAPERFRAWAGPTWKLMFVCEPARMPAAERRLRARLDGELHVVISQEDRLEIQPRGITKAWGLERLAAHLGIGRAEVWAVGDEENDHEMIAWAGHGCAMGQAPNALKGVARHVLPSAAAHGLAALPDLIARHG